MTFLKAGTLDEGDRVRPAIEFYRASAQRWIRRPLPGSACATARHRVRPGC